MRTPATQRADRSGRPKAPSCEALPRPSSARGHVALVLVLGFLLSAPPADALPQPATADSWRHAEVPGDPPDGDPEAEAFDEEELLAPALPWEQAILSGLPQGQPWIAAGLSIALTGTGQFYNHDSPKGWWLFGTLATYPLAMAIDAWTGSGYARVSAFTLMMAAKGYSAWEAYHTAKASASATP